MTARGLEVRVAGVEAEVFGCQLDDALELVRDGHAQGNQGDVDGVEHLGLEGGGLGFANGQGDERHGGGCAMVKQGQILAHIVVIFKNVTRVAFKTPLPGKRRRHLLAHPPRA